MKGLLVMLLVVACVVGLYPAYAEAGCGGALGLCQPGIAVGGSVNYIVAAPVVQAYSAPVFAQPVVQSYTQQVLAPQVQFLNAGYGYQQQVVQQVVGHQRFSRQQNVRIVQPRSINRRQVQNVKVQAVVGGY